MNSKKSSPTLSQAFKELEQITAEFESRNLDLEQGVPKLKKALELAKYLEKRLKIVENEIKEVKAAFGESQSD